MKNAMTLSAFFIAFIQQVIFLKIIDPTAIYSIIIIVGIIMKNDR